MHAQRHMQVSPTAASQQFDVINVFVTHHLLPSFPSPLVVVLPEGDKEQLVSSAVTYFNPGKTEPERTDQRNVKGIRPSTLFWI